MTTLLNLTRAVERFLVGSWKDDSLQSLCVAVAAARVVLDDEHSRGRTEVLAAMVWASDKGKRAVAWEHEHEHEKERFRLYARTILQSGLV